MRKPRDEKIARTVHVKSRTKGDYNELSFNILDKRNSRFEKKAARSKKPVSRDGIPLITLSGGKMRRRGRASEQTTQIVWRPRVVQSERGQRSAQGEQEAIDASPDDLLFSSGVIGNPDMEPEILLADDLRQLSPSRLEQPEESAEAAGPEAAAHATGDGAGVQGALPAAVDADSLAAEGEDAYSVASAPSEASDPAGVDHRLHVSYGEPLDDGAAVLRFAADEAAHQKSGSRRNVLVACVAAALVVLVVVLCAAFLYQLYQKNQSGEAELRESIELIAQTDDALDALDAAVIDPFGDDADELRAAAQEELSEARSSLVDASELTSEAAEELDSPEDQALAEQVAIAISARQEMLDLGETIMATAEEAQFAADCLQSAWNCMLNAADLSSEAALLVTDTTDENVEASKELTESALEELSLAREQLELAENSFDIDLSAYFSYIDKREEALNCAIASDDALLEDDSEEAQAQNDAYNEADEEAASLAEALPEDPSAYVEEVYEDLVEESEEDYDDARSRAATADAFISDYLGE